MNPHVENLTSEGTWSAFVERRAAIRVRPGATIHLQNISLPRTVEIVATPQGNGYRRAVLSMSVRKIGSTTTKGPVAICALVPEKRDHYQVDLYLHPNIEYIFEVIGNPLHLVGEFTGELGEPQRTTEVRRMIQPQRPGGTIQPQRPDGAVSSRQPSVASEQDDQGSEVDHGTVNANGRGLWDFE